MEEIISIVRNLSPVFGGLISKISHLPGVLRLKSAFRDIGIPVFHDDQHGTAIVVFAAMLNFCRMTEEEWKICAWLSMVQEQPDSNQPVYRQKRWIYP